MAGTGVWLQSHDVVQGGNGGLQVQSSGESCESGDNGGSGDGGGGLKISDGPAANEVGRGESIKTMHRLLTQGQIVT